MEGFLLQLWNMSVQISFVIGVVLLVRILFQLARLPKRYSYVLWAIPFLRLCLPFQPESSFSLLPAKSISSGKPAAGYVWRNAVSAVNEVIDTSGVAVQAGGSDFSAGGSRTWMQVGIILAGVIWLVGVMLLFTYSVISCVRLKKSLTCSLRLEENIYLADEAKTPFVFGVFKPRIYLPSDIQESELAFVIAHERTHIRRKDHIIKLIAFFITCIYWFHPLVWLAYFLMGKDMEMACDEAVLGQFGERAKKEYASVLLAQTAGRRRIVGVPLAFGEGNTKKRITNIMKYRKPFVITVAVAVVALVVLAVGLLTNPASTCLLSEVKETGITMPEAANVDAVRVVTGEDSTTFPKAYNQIFTDYIKGLVVRKEPVSQSRSEERAKDIQICFVKGEETVWALYLNADGTQLWQDDGVKPSYTYEIVKGAAAGSASEEPLAFLDRQLGSITEAEESTEEEVSTQLEEQQRMEAEKLLNSGLYSMEILKGTLTSTGMTIQITNQSEEEIFCGEDYKLQYLKGEEWLDVPYVIDNWAFNEPAYVIGQQALRMEVDWEWLYGELPAGTYLFTKTAGVEGETDTNGEINLGVMFSLE